MRKHIFLVVFLCMSLLLAGCISIPMGDKVLEISTKGIEFVDKEEEDALEEELDEEQVEQKEDDQTDEDTKDTEDTEGEAEEDTGDAEESCEEQDYAAIADDLKEDFFIPECALLLNVAKTERELTVYFSVDGGDWQETFYSYQEYFGETLTEESQNPVAGNARLKAYPDALSNSYTQVDLEQVEEGLQIRVIQLFPEGN